MSYLQILSQFLFYERNYCKSIVLSKWFGFYSSNQRLEIVSLFQMKKVSFDSPIVWLEKGTIIIAFYLCGDLLPLFILRKIFKFNLCFKLYGLYFSNHRMLNIENYFSLSNKKNVNFRFGDCMTWKRKQILFTFGFYQLLCFMKKKKN